MPEIKTETEDFICDSVEESNGETIEEKQAPEEEEIAEEMKESQEIDNPENKGISEETRDDKLESIIGILIRLESLYNEKIHNDTHLRELNNKLYTELKKYQDGFVDSFMESVFSEIILIINDLEKQAANIPKEATDENYNKLLKRFSDVPIRLLDLLYEHDVEPYNEPGDDFTPKRQEVVSVIKTNDPSFRNKNKEVVSKGYLRHIIDENGNTVDRILRKEKVIAYKYEEAENE